MHSFCLIIPRSLVDKYEFQYPIGSCQNGASPGDLSHTTISRTQSTAHQVTNVLKLSG